jgi:putative copper resistance protein D
MPFSPAVVARCKFVAGAARLALAGALFLALCSGVPMARAQDHDHMAQQGHEGMVMPNEHLDPAAEAAHNALLLSWKRESEFNHHLAGVFVVLAGLFILAEGSLRDRWPFLRYAWPGCFLLSGLFVLIFSDTELWPFGPQSWWFGLTHNHEDLQHKTFAVLLLGLAFIEIQRARGVLKAAWAAWAFPVLAAAGSILLLFHEHHSGMHGPDHMAAMQSIQSQHRTFSITGFSIGFSKALSEVRTGWRSIFANLWPVLLIVLGVLLILYTE